MTIFGIRWDWADAIFATAVAGNLYAASYSLGLVAL